MEKHIILTTKLMSSFDKQDYKSEINILHLLKIKKLVKKRQIKLMQIKLRSKFQELQYK